MGRKSHTPTPSLLLMSQAIGLDASELDCPEGEEEVDGNVAGAVQGVPPGAAGMATSRARQGWQLLVNSWSGWATALTPAAETHPVGEQSDVVTAALAHFASGRQARLPRLVVRFGAVLEATLEADPTACSPPLPPPTSSASAAPEANVPAVSPSPTTAQSCPSPTAGPASAAAQLLPLPGHHQLDALASLAAARSADLAADRDKGCRLRKKKGLADLLAALTALGVSRRQADVPSGDRDVVAWFKHPAPQLRSLLISSAPSPANPGTLTNFPAGVEGSNIPAAAPLDERGAVMRGTGAAEPGVEAELAGRRADWAKASAYYFRGVARLQKLWSAAESNPHRDLSLSEAQAVRRLSEHLMFLARRQRAALAQLDDTHGALQRVTDWLANLSPPALQLDPQHTPHQGVLDAGSAAASKHTQQHSPNVVLVPQARTLAAARVLKGEVDEVEMLVADSAALLQACSAARACSSSAQEAALQAAGAKCRLWLPLLSSAKAEADQAIQGSQLVAVDASIAVAWASPGLLLRLHRTVELLHDIAAQATDFVHSSSDTADGFAVPGLVALAQRITRASQVAATAVAGLPDCSPLPLPAPSLQPSFRPASAAAQAPQVSALHGSLASSSAQRSSSEEAAWELQLTQEAAALSRELEDAVSSLLLWSQAVAGTSQGARGAAQPPTQAPLPGGAAHELSLQGGQQQGAGTAEGQAGPAGPVAAGVTQWMSNLTASTQLPRLNAALERVLGLMARVGRMTDMACPTAPAAASPPSHAPGPSRLAPSAALLLDTAQRRLAGLAPLMALVAFVLQQRAGQWLQLHRATTKLAYITITIFGNLLLDGYCAPQGEEGAGAEGGDGPGEFKEVAGTGMGEGDTRGAKDVSDKITDEDQLLGAQQRDAPKEPDQPQPQGDEEKEQDKPGPEPRLQGVEMEADFEGSLHDMDVDRGANDEQSDQEGDEQHMEQQMGEVGPNEERVDERLWDKDEEEAGGQEQGQQRKEEYDDKGSISVDDKKDLEYGVRGECPGTWTWA
ncbi:hypothetical protein QJQ45_028121 [Haematococcus lacustris]|nr:hypothetical protein QJQ45_028121 [Haematococcus lacustris]